MIQPLSLVNITDNTGAKYLRIIKVLGYSKKAYASVGDVVVGAVQNVSPKGIVKKKQVVKAVVVRTVSEIRRKDGTVVRFDDNAVVVLNQNGDDMRGTRVFGPVAREVREKVKIAKIMSLAPEVL